MRTAVAFFSGTGNTVFVAEYVRDKLAALGITADLLSVEQTPAGRLAEYDLLCFGFPVYEMDAPKFVREYVSRIPAASGKGAFVFCTAGLLAGNAVRRSLKRLAAKGFVPLGYAVEIMPGSDGLAMMAKDSKYVRKALSRDYSRLGNTDKMIGAIARAASMPGRFEEIAVRLPFDFSGFLLNWSWFILSDPFLNSMKKKFYADETCTRCGMCEKFCPAGSIRVTGEKVEFSTACVLCMRCIHHCPSGSIQLGRMTVGKFRWKGPDGKFKPLKIAAKPGERMNER